MARKKAKSITETRKLAKKFFEQAGKNFEVAPYNVTSSQFWSLADGPLTEWEIRRTGGLSNLRDEFFKSSVECIKDPEWRPTPVIEKRRKGAPKLAPEKLRNFDVYGDSMQDLYKRCGLKKNDILKYIVMPDTHVPEHDQVAVNAFCDFLKFYKPNAMSIIGDFMEMGSVSHWGARDCKPRRLVPEFEMGRKILDQVSESAGEQCKDKKFFIGNHEDWLQQYLNMRIPEVADGLERLGQRLDVESLLGIKNFGFDIVPLNAILEIGDAHFIHGYYTGKSHAAKHLEVFGVNVYYGHLHDVQSYSAVSVKGLHEAASLGCLRSLNAPFLKGKPNNWSHAFGIFEFQYDGSYTRYIPIIVDGKFSYNGKLFDGN